MSTTITIHGKATSKPGLERTSSGLEICKVTISVNRELPSTRGDRRTAITSFFNVKAFGPLARHAHESIEKGTRLVVTGRLDQRSWETPQGDVRSALEIVADDIAASLLWAPVTVSRSKRSDPLPLIEAPELPRPPMAIVR